MSRSSLRAPAAARGPMALAAAAIAAVAMAWPAPARAQSKAESRYLAPLSFGVRLGGMVAYSSPNGAPSGVGGGAYALFDQQSLLADLGVDIFGGDGLFQLTGGLGVYWAMLPQGNITPYFGGGARLGYVKFGGDGAVGLQLLAAAGVLASRHWSPNVRIELAWFFDTMGEKEKGGGPRHYSNGPMATIGLGF